MLCNCFSQRYLELYYLELCCFGYRQAFLLQFLFGHMLQIPFETARHLTYIGGAESLKGAYLPHGLLFFNLI